MSNDTVQFARRFFISLCLLTVTWLLVAFGCLWIGEVGAAPAPTPAVEQDVLLILYRGERPPPQKRIDEICLKLIREVGCSRVIVYPDSYTPILVPDKEIPRVRELLGRDRCVQLTPFDRGR